MSMFDDLTTHRQQVIYLMRNKLQVLPFFIQSIFIHLEICFPGYVQGMSDLLSPILFLMEDEVEAFWCFAGFMEKLVRNLHTQNVGGKYCLMIQLYFLVF